jgi:signal peptide peptidase SppA
MKFLLDLFSRSLLWAIRPEAVALAFAPLHAPKLLELPPEHGESQYAVADGILGARPSIRGNGPNKTAIVPIHGVLTKDGPAWYGSNYDTIGQAVEDAVANPDVKRIILHVDSPGGEVVGAPETGDIIAQASKAKPVSAIVDGMCASAAYWLASQARDITVTPSGEVGSVGVRMMHADLSKMLDDQGVKITELSSGDFKTEWSPFKPLTDEAKANMQQRLDDTHTQFLNVVASGRGERASQQMREGRFGEGRMFSSKDALSHGLVDTVQSSRDFFKAVIPAQEQDSSAPAFPLRARSEQAIAIARKRVDGGHGTN